jgi:pre-mRNA-splicing factor SYF1
MSFTEHRRIWNRAFQSVAVTQHDKIWKVLVHPLLQYDSITANNNNNKNNNSMDDDPSQLIRFLPWETAHRLLYRHTQYDFESTREYAVFCETHARYGAAAQAYVDLLNRSLDTTQQQSSYWQSFCELVAQHSIDVEEKAGIDWETILQTAIQNHIHKTPSTHKNDTGIESTKTLAVVTTNTNNNTMLGLLYSWLASAWIQRGNFDMARSVYEEGILTVRTVRDFSILFAAYLQLEEGLLTAITDSMDDWEDENMEENQDGQTREDEDDWDLLLSSESESTRNKLTEMEVAMARAEHLTARRPLLLNAVKLRQNPNQCAEWIQRAELYLEDGQSRQAATVLEEALQTVQNRTPGISAVVIRLVRVYEQSMDDLAAARDLLDRVCRQRTTALGISRTEELAECWATWIELELKHENWDEALALARQSVAPQGGQSNARRKPLNLTKSLRLWDLLLDLEESLGTVQTTKDAYNRALEIKVATVQHILNFGSFLAEHKYFEESLTAYERGIELFPFPHIGAKLLWKAYLDAFLKRYGGTKVERARNLFQRCTNECSPEDCAEFFIMNGEFEEEFGLTKRALSVYKALCDKVPEDEKYNAYQLLIAKTTKYLGIPATRDIYQEAVEKLKDPKSFVKICQDFAKMEMTLQEVDRARAIFAYGAQSADPRRMPEYWKDWNDFEIANGNEDSFRDMLRVKRSVEAAFSTVNYNAAGMAENIGTLSTEEAMAMVANAEGVEIEEPKITTVQGFVPSKRLAASTNLEDVEERVAKLRKATGMSSVKDNMELNEHTGTEDGDDDNEIDIDDIDAEIEAAAAEGAVSSAQGHST